MSPSYTSLPPMWGMLHGHCISLFWSYLQVTVRSPKLLSDRHWTRQIPSIFSGGCACVNANVRLRPSGLPLDFLHLSMKSIGSQVKRSCDLRGRINTLLPVSVGLYPQVMSENGSTQLGGEIRLIQLVAIHIFTFRGHSFQHSIFKTSGQTLFWESNKLKPEQKEQNPV